MPGVGLAEASHRVMSQQRQQKPRARKALVQQSGGWIRSGRAILTNRHEAKYIVA